MGDDQTTQTFSQQFIDEAIILSDLLDLNELAAVELLMAGELKRCFFRAMERKGGVEAVFDHKGKTFLSIWILHDMEIFFIKDPV